MTRAVLWTATAAYAAAFSALSILEHRAFNTGRFDLGNMTQVVWSTAHGRPLEMTDLRGDQIVRLGAHVDPILALFAPLWWAWPSPSMLVTVQAVAVALGALPLFGLARKHLESERAALGVALAYLLYPSLQWMTLSELHPPALATPLLLLAIRALDDDRLVVFAASATLAVLTKEHVALAVAGLGVWYAVTRRPRTGLAIAGAGLAWTAVAVAVVVPYFNEGGASDFYGRYEGVGGSPAGIAETALTDPLALAGAVTESRDLAFVAKLVLPLLAVPLAAPLVLVVALPELGLDLMSAARTQTSIHFHYAATIIPALFAATVLALRRFRARERAALALVAATLVANYVLGPLPLWSALPGGSDLQADSWRRTPHADVAERALELIPDDAAVSASNSLGAHLSERRRILAFPYVRDADWIAVDETRPGYADRAFAPRRFAIRVAQIRRNPRWRLVFAEDGVLIFRRVR